ncbi:MAG: ComF family protein [Lachnospiraceae bacterium]|nr:ComF family protein [Lachnospiraceae bacterium]
MFDKIRNFIAFLVQLVYPGRCPLCDDIVVPFGKTVCTECYRKIRYIRQPVCNRCGKELGSTEKMLCGDCTKRPHNFTKGRAVFPYDEIAPSLYRFKYAGRKEYARFYGEEAVRLLGDEILSWNVDAIIPVPIHISRWRKRGYNQAKEVAKVMGKKLGIPVLSGLVRRTKKTVPMKVLGLSERQNNLKKAFHIGRNDVRLKRVLIVDDIYTTGSTIDAMADKLRQHAVQDIYFVAIAIGSGV